MSTEKKDNSADGAVSNELLNEASRRIELLQRASANLPGGYHRCLFEEGYPFLFVSESFQKITGYTTEQLEKELDNKCINLVLSDDLARFLTISEGIKQDGSADITYRIRRRNGDIRWVQNSSMLVDWDGILCLQCTIADITDFIEQQSYLAKENTELEELAANIPCGYHRCTTENGFRLDFVSDSFLETVGCEKEEVLGKPYIEIVAPEDRELFMSHEPELISTGRVDLVYRIVRKDGARRWIKDSTQRVEKGGSSYYQCILVDITDFVNEQENMLKKNLELMHQNTLLEVMEHNMPGGYHRCAKAEGWPFLYFGQSFEKITGWTKAEIEDDFGGLFINLVWEDDIPLCAGIINDVEKNGYSNAIYRLKKKGGGYIWISDSTMEVTTTDSVFYHGVLADVTYQIEEIEKAKRAAEASNHAKSTFLFNASHDIRTPMNAIQGYAHIINENADNEEVVKNTVQKIIQSGNTLMTLLNDVLDLSRIERGKDNVEAKPLNLSLHSEKLYEMFVFEMEQAEIDFRMENDISHPNVLTDDLKLTRIVMNALSNAKKFTSRGGSVTFGVKESEYTGDFATYTFFVRDTGIGMSEEFQRRAFEQFERERSSTESGITGSGLGLAIIKRFSELMGGECFIKSKIGEGTEISISIKLELSETIDKNVSCGKSEINFNGKRVLLVEDNEFNREIARYILEGGGFEVDEAENGVVCLNMLTDAPSDYYDLILMDIQMPKMDGYTATSEIRNFTDKKKADVPIIAMTANAFFEDKQKCISVGMSGHIGKPLDSKAVFEKIAEILELG